MVKGFAIAAIFISTLACAEDGGSKNYSLILGAGGSTTQGNASMKLGLRRSWEDWHLSGLAEWQTENQYDKLEGSLNLDYDLYKFDKFRVSFGLGVGYAYEESMTIDVDKVLAGSSPLEAQGLSAIKNPDGSYRIMDFNGKMVGTIQNVSGKLEISGADGSLVASSEDGKTFVFKQDFGFIGNKSKIGFEMNKDGEISFGGGRIQVSEGFKVITIVNSPGVFRVDQVDEKGKPIKGNQSLFFGVTSGQVTSINKKGGVATTNGSIEGLVNADKMNLKNGNSIGSGVAPVTGRYQKLKTEHSIFIPTRLTMSYMLTDVLGMELDYTYKYYFNEDIDNDSLVSVALAYSF